MTNESFDHQLAPGVFSTNMKFIVVFCILIGGTLSELIGTFEVNIQHFAIQCLIANQQGVKYAQHKAALINETEVTIVLGAAQVTEHQLIQTCNLKCTEDATCAAVKTGAVAQSTSCFFYEDVKFVKDSSGMADKIFLK